MHETFWKVMAPASSRKNKPAGEILKAIEKEFGSFERFKTEFSETAKSVEGSGWAILSFNKKHSHHDKHQLAMLMQQIF